MIRSIFILLLILNLSCSIGVRTRSLFGEKLIVEVVSESNANGDSPVALDLVLVYNDKLVKEISKLKAREWFEKKEQIKNDYFPEAAYSCWAWEWIPGQKIPLIKLPLVAKAKAGFLFSNYRSKGDHRYGFNPFKNFKIVLKKDKMIVKLLQ